MSRRLAAMAVGLVSLFLVSTGVAEAGTAYTYRRATSRPFTTQAECEVVRASYNDPPDVYVGASCYTNGIYWFFDYRYRID